MGFKRKKRKISLPEIEEPEWIKVTIEALRLKKGSYGFLPVYGGVLLYILDEGIAWLPKKQILGIIKKSSINQTIEKYGLTVIDEFIPIPLEKITNKITRDILKHPPSMSQYYLQSFIKHVEIIPREHYSELFGFIDDKIKSKGLNKQDDERGALFIAEITKEADFAKIIREKLSDPDAELTTKKSLKIKKDKESTFLTLKKSMDQVVKTGKKLADDTNKQLRKIRSKVVTGRSNYFIFRYSNVKYFDHFMKALEIGSVDIKT